VPSCEGDGVFSNPSFPYRTGTLADAPSSDGVKARKGEANNLKPTKADDEVSAVVTSCIYGSVTSLTALGKDVVVGFEVTSNP